MTKLSTDRSIANYFDNAASTGVAPTVLDEMLPWLQGDFGNANSIHTFGMRAASAVELARERIASLLEVSPEEIFFTSGATESNNWVLKAFDQVAVSPFEHNSVLETARALGHSLLENDGYCLKKAPHGVELVSVMHANNETGAILDLPAYSEKAKNHRDVTQSLGKVPIDLSAVDYASMSAHKLYGPKGAGALFVRNAEPLKPLIIGGGQENGFRAGTLNVPGIVGFGAACALAADNMDINLHHVQSLRETVKETLSKVSDCQVNEHTSNSPYVLSVSFFGVEGETLVVEADAMGFAISSVAACSSRSASPSHVLKALGIEPEWLHGTVRISFSRWNTVEAARGLAKVLADCVSVLRSRGK